MTSINLSLDRIRSITMLALTRNGFSDKQARAVADVVTRAEADGCQSHGLYRVPGYVAAVRSGRANGAAEPQVNMRAPGVIYVDGDRGFAPAAFEAARTALVSAARQNGIAALACGNTHHFSALWADLEPLIAADLVAWCYVVGQCAVAPHGGVRRLLGTNPVAFGWPRPEGGAFIFDFATSAAARGEVELRNQAGERLPEGWAIDSEGNPTVHAGSALGGALLPFGGHKGSALSMMVELIAGPLIGERTSGQVARLDISDGGPPPGGELFVVIDPSVFGVDAREAGEGFFAEALSQPGVRLPSQRRYETRKRSEGEGVEVSSALLQKIEMLGHDA